ncbi:MAG: hypothetical protein ACTSRZ_17580 [Promethearchaeota archaeon]
MKTATEYNTIPHFSIGIWKLLPLFETSEKKKKGPHHRYVPGAPRKKQSSAPSLPA